MTSARMLDRFGEHRLALLGLVDFAAGALMRSTGWLPAAVAGSLVLGFALPWSVLAVINVTQRRTPTRCKVGWCDLNDPDLITHERID